LYIFSVIKDIKTGFIVSDILSKNNDTKIYIDLAEKFRDKTQKTTIHSDNDSQYISCFAKRYVKKNNLIISLSRLGNSVDNGICGTFFSSLKEEWKTTIKIIDWSIYSIL